MNTARISLSNVNAFDCESVVVLAGTANARSAVLNCGCNTMVNASCVASHMASGNTDTGGTSDSGIRIEPPSMSATMTSNKSVISDCSELCTPIMNGVGVESTSIRAAGRIGM